MEMFAEAVVREYALRKGDGPGAPDTLYIGGGTPSVLPLSVLSRIVSAVTGEDRSVGRDEFTVEVNPDDIVRGGPGYAEALRELGADSHALHQEVIDHLEACGLTDVVLVGQEFAGTRHHFLSYPDATALVEDLRRQRPAGKTILIKGSNSLHLDTVAQALEEEK